MREGDSAATKRQDGKSMRLSSIHAQPTSPSPCVHKLRADFHAIAKKGCHEGRRGIIHAPPEQ